MLACTITRPSEKRGNSCHTFYDYYHSLSFNDAFHSGFCAVEGTEKVDIHNLSVNGYLGFHESASLCYAGVVYKNINSAITRYKSFDCKGAFLFQRDITFYGMSFKVQVCERYFHLFNAFPIPQREAGARRTLRYVGELAAEGHSLLVFPEGRRTDAGEIRRFKPGVGMIASRLCLPVVPVRLEGVDRVLHRTTWFIRPGRVKITFGEPMALVGDDYEALAARVERAVRELP